MRHQVMGMALGTLAAAPFLFPVLAWSSLSVHPNSYEIVVQAGTTAADVLHITNNGPASPLGYTVSDDSGWMSEEPESGQILIGEQADVTVTFDAAGLAPGTYTGTISVGDPHHGGIPIAVSLTVNSTVGVEEGWVDLPTGIALAQSRPNPTSAGAEFAFRVQEEQEALLRVYSLSGAEVATLFSGRAARGETRVAWGGTDRAGRALASGLYFYRLDASAGALVGRFLVVR